MMLYYSQHTLFKSFIAMTLVSLLSIYTFGASMEELDEKRALIAMRTIGHQLLESAGDCDSRVMPIESRRTNSKYHLRIHSA